MISKTGIFLQARLGSTRLPGKALLELEGSPIITHAMNALSAVKADYHVLLTDKSSLPAFKPLADSCGFKVFAGSEDDVLNRYVEAGRNYGVKTIIRATGDNPLVDADAVQLILESHRSVNADYSGYDGMPLGTGVEILEFSALVQAEKSSVDKYDHEHVSPYLYKNPELFKINRIKAPEHLCLPGSVVTVDTEDDYNYLKELYHCLYKGQPLSIIEIIPWLKEHRRFV